MRVIVDRFEGEYAVLELPDRKTKDVLLSELPNDIQPGDCLRYENGKYIVDAEETKKRKTKIDDLFKSLKKE